MCRNISCSTPNASGRYSSQTGKAFRLALRLSSRLADGVTKGRLGAVVVGRFFFDFGAGGFLVLLSFEAGRLSRRIMRLRLRLIG